MKTSFTPGKIWLDSEGIPIQAHGGCVLHSGGMYYWFGENKSAKTKPGSLVGSYVEAIGVSCYASTDLLNWKNMGLVLPAVNDAPEHDLHISKIIERPKVIYNEPTGRFVMYVHVDTPDYQYARLGIATSEKVTGPYEYLGSVKPHERDCRDMTVFKDADGKAYLLHASDWNATLVIGELSRDYLQTTSSFTKNFEREYREAPAVFKRLGKYYLLTSGCTGWDPNPAQVAVAEKVLGPWIGLGNPCFGPGADKTFSAQSAFIFSVFGMEEAYIAVFDRWDKNDLGDSHYVWLPIRFYGEEMRIEWMDEWDLDYFG
jgi:hypothetical protein